MSRTFLLPAILIIVFACAMPAIAGVYTVTSSAGTVDEVCDVDCTLGDAVAAAMGTFSDDDIIVFSPSIFGSTITLSSPLNIAGEGDLSIEGPGADQITISGGGTTGLFKMEDETSVFKLRIAGLKLADGSGSSSIGGAVVLNLSHGNLELDRVHVHGNNAAIPRGGAIAHLGMGSLRITNSTFTQNTAATGAAVYLIGNAPVTITNSTFSGNTSTFDGGAIFLDAGASAPESSLKNVTITGNNGPGGGVTVRTGTIRIGNSIIAGNTHASFPEVRRKAAATVISEGFNHIGDNVGDAAATESAIKWAGTDTRDTPPLLGALSINGGRFPSMLPQAGSPLIDSGSNVLAPVGMHIDQRGHARITNSTIDKGAVEAGAAPAIANITGRLTDENSTGVRNTYVVLSDGRGNDQVLFSSSLGYFTVTGVPAGESYIVQVYTKRWVFLPISFSLNSDVDNADLPGTSSDLVGLHLDGVRSF